MSARRFDRIRLALAGGLILAFSLRLAAVLNMPLDYRLESDAVRHVTTAQHLLTWGEFSYEAGAPYALIPPGYPLFVAAVLALTNQSLLAVRLAQAVLGTSLVWLTYLVGREAGSRQVGLGSALLCAVYPVWIVWPALFLTETLYTVFLLAFVWYLLRSLKEPTAANAALTGATFGLALLTREVLLFFPLLLPLACWRARLPWRRAARYLLAFVLVALAVIAPWLVRNYLTFGQVFFTERTEALRYRLTGSGYLSARYASLAGGDSFEQIIDQATQRRNELYGTSGEWLSIRALLSRPGIFLRHLANRFAELWLHANGLESLPDSPALRAAYTALHVALLGLAGAGVFAGLKRRNLAAGVIGLLLVYASGVLLFFRGPIPRYTLPFLPLVFALAALGAVWIVQAAKRAGWL